VPLRQQVAVAIGDAMRFHPADGDADGRLSIGELTAYGAAWKQGEGWASGPTPIPIAYVTRAGALWKQGERYGDNGGELPGAWIQQ